jgi:hypothetical protein
MNVLRERGVAQRKIIGDLVLLQGGQPLPSKYALAWLLNIDHRAAARQLGRYLADAGLTVHTKGRGKGRRLWLL